VVHEFGHALGCIHEHQSPEVTLNWNKEAVYAAFSGPPNNWTKEAIDQNILDKYSPDGIDATAFDRKSIMLYQFDASLFTPPKATPLNTELSKHDEAFIRTMYPINCPYSHITRFDLEAVARRRAFVRLHSVDPGGRHVAC
jgi:hypothetical protein